jgi:7,8-dihydropterin-6-yl-methyl-4-(beta-D-ribofuranosyl)aminobenzene 5'-phosphate synthase
MTMSRRTIAGQPRIPGSGILISIALVFLVRGLLDQATAQTTQHQIQRFNITILSTMLVGDTIGIGEWGFAALVDVDGHRILVDTGAHPDTVIRNAHDLHIDLSDVQEVILTHYHWDHVSGLLMLRRELMKHNPKALSIVHVSDGIFDSRPSETGERNQMIAIRKEYEATGGRFIVHSSGAELIPGVWLTGPVPRVYSEHNWSGPGKVLTASGLVEDSIPEDSSLVVDTPKGLVVITGCGHAGIVNIVTFAEKHFADKPIYGIVGGLHLFAATDEVVDWTASKLLEFHVANLLAAHCTGIEATFRLRQDLGLSRKTAVVASVGSSFSLADGIEAGPLAK